jgi:hypothetical protein
MTGALPVQGLSSQAVTVLSVDGNTAYVRSDHTGGRFPVARDVLRAHALPPMPGERWIVDRAYGSDWTFAAIIDGDVVNPVLTVGNAAERLAIRNPFQNLAVYQLDSYSIWYYDGAAWVERIPPNVTALQAQVAALQTQVNGLPRGLLKIVRWPSDITIVNTASILMESLSVPVVAGRSYEVLWHCNQAGSLAAGPPNGQASLVSAVGSVTAGSPSLRGSGIRVYNATQEVITLTATFDATANETRAFGIAANSGSSSASITFYGAQGRFLSVKDVGLTPS